MGEPLPVARALHERRLALDVSRAAAAARMHASPAALRSWELGERGMALEQTYLWAATLGARPAVVAGERVPVPLAACREVEPPQVPPAVTQLRGTRRARELSRPEVAGWVGVAETTVLYWETGERSITLARTHDFANVLGLVLTVEEISPSLTALVEAGGAPHVRRTG